MLRQREFINDAGASIIMTVQRDNGYERLIIEHEDYNGEGGPVHEQEGSHEEIDRAYRDWISTLKGLRFRPVA